jgi:RHS repeat-associated protein
MGNIATLSRYLASTQIDALTYNYTNAGNPTNQVQAITDASGSNAGLVNGTTTYTYDGNGNMLSGTNTVNTAQNKSFTYNLLNLPLVATTPTGTVTYTYDAAGNKLRKLSTGLNNTTDYVSGIQYDGAITPALSFIQTEDGKAVPTTSGGYDYYYYLSDNLGNTRITFDTQTGTAIQLQKDDYFPFGMEINSGVISPKNEYLYNKKELQEELGQYDYEHRFYDPVIGRFTTIDRLAEAPEQIDLSPYAYVGNNPIIRTDPHGDCPICIIFAAEVIEAAVTATVAAVAIVGTVSIISHANNGIGRPVMQRDAIAPTPAIVQSHGNKLDDKPAERYSLRDKNTTEVKKHGETTRGEDKNGQGNQKRYSQKELDEKNVDYKKENSGTKKDMHQEQHKEILEHKKNNNGQRPDFNKNDY